MTYFRTLILTILVFLAGTKTAKSQFGFSLTGGNTEVTIPFEVHNNLIIIPVVLNNAIPLKFILDTGVRTAILTEKTISDLMQISYDRKISIVGGGGGDTVDAYIAHNVTLHLPGVQGKGQPILILAQDYLRLKNSMGHNIHGILGYEIFGRFVVKIDYVNRMLTLIEPAAFKPKRKDKAIPLTIEDTKPYISVMLTINDTTSVNSKLMIDSGASHSLLLDAASHEDITIPEKVVDGKLGRGLTGDIEGYLGRVEKIRLEEFEFKNIIASFPDEVSYRSIREGTERNGTVGSGLLSRFYVTYDYLNSKLYLKKNKKYRVGFEYNMSGIDLEASGPNFSSFIISYVRKDSPAEAAGVMVGDQIIMINGLASKNLRMGDIFNILSSKPGKNIKLKLRRNNQEFVVKFELERLI